MKLHFLVISPNTYDKANLNSDHFPDVRFTYIDGPDEKHPDIVSWIESIKKDYDADTVDGVISTQDYPGVSIAEILNEHWKLPTAGFEASLQFQNKILFRQHQASVLDKYPCQFWPTHYNENKSPPIEFPCFIKPAKGVFSYFAKELNSYEVLLKYLESHQESVSSFLKIMESLQENYAPTITKTAPFILEERLHGRLITVDGYMYKGRAVIIGMVDSETYHEHRAFRSFTYPSKVPTVTQNKISVAITRLLETSQFSHGMFNAEVFYDLESQSFNILEVNPRMFFAAADFYEKVDGTNTYQTLLNLAKGNQPNQHLYGKGEFEVAGTFTPRYFRDAFVKNAPELADIEKIQKLYPDALLSIEYSKGMLLSDKIDSFGSYKYAIINIGASDWDALEKKYQTILSMLGFEFLDI